MSSPKRLKEYERKRKFNKTPEPAPRALPKGRGPLKFVVQKHAATRTHYDFRLELDGTLLSWAVPRGPTLTSGDPRLAVHVEDHPMDYGDFEGVIPKGNYGAGTVMVWDEGTFVERGSTGRADSEAALREGMKKGHLTFILHGHKLRGEFALVKIQKKGAPPNGWLLVKKHDAEAARHDILEADRSVLTERSMEEIAAESTGKGDVWIPGKGRKGKAKPLKRKSPPPLKTGPPVTRRELKAAPLGPRPSAAKEMPRRLRPMEAVSSSALPKSEWIFEQVPTGIRAIAEVQPGGVRIHSRSLLPLERKYPAVAAALKKLKGTYLLDGVLVGSGKAARFVVSDLLFQGNQDLRTLPLEKRKASLAKLSLAEPLEVAPFSTRPTAFAGLPVYTAKAAKSYYRSGLSKDWLKIKGSGKGSKPGREESERPPITHADKVYWPDEGITKGDLVAYYETVAPFILPHLIDRPQSLHRQPDGLRNEGFFHKDQTGYLPKRVKTVRVFSGSSEKTINYALCQDTWSLLYLANLGCIELNPWLSRQPNLEHPDYVVIDLDPDGNDFKQVIQVALEVKKILDAVGAESFCKTSGSSGLHICIPTGAKYDFDTGREFAEAICRYVHGRLPRITSVERNPNKRPGRIYLDFLQNRRSQTLAAPYCVRPRPHATVSAPLKWSELKPGLKPSQFTMASMPERLKRVGDLWKPMLEKAVDLPACMKRLSKKLHK